MSEDTRLITNTGPTVMQVLFEPWSAVHELKPDETFRIIGTSPYEGSMEVVETDDLVIVYAWPGATLQLFNGDVPVDDPVFGIGFPELPPGMSMRGFTELMFGSPARQGPP
jgi:hypothetical protein